MQNILALQALELDTVSDAYVLESWSTISYQCCTQTHTAELISTIQTFG